MRRTKKHGSAIHLIFWLLLLATWAVPFNVRAFVHPGGLHTLADLEWMKTNVLAGNHPWIDDWNVLVTDSQAQSNYLNHATADFNASRQNADADAHAVYLNTLRWYISGDINFANTATNILNTWAYTVTTNTETGGGLSGLPTMSFALAGELLRTYSGWKAADFAAFTNMMVQHLYPSCSNFITYQPSQFAHWTSWDSPSAAAIIAIGVLCDDTNMFNQAVNFYKYGAPGTGYGSGAISNAAPFLYGSLGQPMESGRDQEHCSLGIGDLGVLCQVAWNQGADLYGFANNRLLSVVEYLARYNLSHNVPYTSLNSLAGAPGGGHLFFVSKDGHSRIDDRPIYEMFYNHYVVQQGLDAPDLTAMAALYRPEHGSRDHFGYGTLAYTLNASASPNPPAPLPVAPTGLTAQAGISQVTLNWIPAAGDLAQGYDVLRSTASGGPYVMIASWNANTFPSYADTNVVNGTTYYYVVTANNQSGSSARSAAVNATPMDSAAVPSGWTSQDVGVVNSPGNSEYASAGNNTFIVTGSGTGIGGTTDGGFHYTCVNATNDFTIVARLTTFSADEVGLMMRASLAANSALVQFDMRANARQSTFGIRQSTAANLNHYDSGDQFTYAPTWYKLVRSGSTISAYQSDDGVNWVFVQSATPSFGSTYYAGIIINSGSATFDNVVYTNAAVWGTFAPPAAPKNLSADVVTGSQVSLSWSAVTDASGYNIKRSTVSGSGYTGIASNISGAAFCDTTVSANVTYHYVVSALNGGGESLDSSEASVIMPAVSPVPSTPAYLTATPDTAKILLNWSASIGALSYTVRRSTTSGGPYTNIATGVTASFADTNVVAGTYYFYVVSAVNGSGESASSSQVVGMLPNQLSGTIIGTSGSWGNLGNTITNVFDGDLNTYFDGPDASGDWCGLDFGVNVSNVIAEIQYCPRATFAGRMVGGMFQGANDPGFTNPVTLFAITATPSYSAMTTQTVGVTNAFRYVRYVGPGSGYCNVAEIEFDGNAFVLTPSAPTNFLAAGGSEQVSLNWSSVPTAYAYNLKRSVTDGGPYSLISAAQAATHYLDTNVLNGVAYHYVVSALNDGGESTNSSAVSVRPTSTMTTPLNLTESDGQLQFNWAQDHTGWLLQAQTNPLSGGLGTNWVSVVKSDSTNCIALPMGTANSSVFFRLCHP